MKIQVLGPGCLRCQTLAANAEQAIKEVGVDAEIEKVTNFKEIAKFGVMMTPGLAIDGELKSAGKVLSAAEIAVLLRG